MKKVVAAITAVGMASGLLLAIGAWFLRIPALLAIVFLSVLGLLVAATHWANWEWVRDPSDQEHPRRRLFVFNLAWLVFWVVMFRYSHDVWLIVLSAVYLLPFAVNAIYLCAPTAAGWHWISCGLLGLVLVTTVLIWHGPMPESSYESLGRVLEGGTGRPLIGARVTLDCMNSGGSVRKTLQTTSGANGAYEFRTSDIRECDSINVHGSKDGYVTGGLDSTFGHDDRYHIVLTPPSELTMQNITGLAILARAHQSPNDGYHFVLVFSDFFEAMHIAKTERETALVRQSFCPLLMERWAALSDWGRSFARAQHVQTAQGEGVAVVDYDGVVVPYCAPKE
jgi:hypothetical protein